LLGVTFRLLPESEGFWQLTRFLWNLVMTNRVPRGIREPAVFLTSPEAKLLDGSPDFVWRTPTVSRVEGGFDTAVRVRQLRWRALGALLRDALKECRSHNSTRPMKGSRESVSELRGLIQKFVWEDT